ncbi:MAG: hypothetical protein HY909_20335 [Deltaproteobacteria bacterium]|nr:hypothetical protein [Deltaproteobacteria bacterium]
MPVRIGGLWGVSPADPQEGPRRALEAHLSRSVGAPLVVSITDNRRTMLSIRREGALRRVRLHHMFLDAPEGVLDAVGRYLSHGEEGAGRSIDTFIAENQHRIHRRRVPRRPWATRGRVFDLSAVLASLVGRYFPAMAPVAVTWGRSASGLRTSSRRRTIRMGTYYLDEALIRIHPALDQAWVPLYFLEWVLYHELLHHVVPMPVINGRRCYHTEEFRTRELAFEDYTRARDWERRNLRRLLASRDG